MHVLADLLPPRPATPAFPEWVAQHPVITAVVGVVLLLVVVRWWRGKSKGKP
ncbi:MAG: hypothetical protein U1F71_00670 [Verrucomicrobiaceae bacterium]